MQKRHDRKMCQDYAVPRAVDLRLRRSAEQLGYPEECDVIDTTKRRTKRQDLKEIDQVIDTN